MKPDYRSIIGMLVAVLSSPHWVPATENSSEHTPSETIAVIQSSDAICVEIEVLIDECPLEAYWETVFEKIFEFADINQNDQIDQEELIWVPSARAIRLSLGNGFVPPVAAVSSLQSLTGREDLVCDQDALATYYREHGIGRPQVGDGQLQHSQSLHNALLAQLDRDQDEKVSRQEWLAADEQLRKLDVNDDELINAAELVPGIQYPGAAGTHALTPHAVHLLSETASPSSAIARLGANGVSTPGQLGAVLTELADTSRSVPTIDRCDTIRWSITLGDSISTDVAGTGPSQVQSIDLWAIAGPLPMRLKELQDQLPESVHASAGDEPTDNNNRRSRRPSFDWLVTVVDQDRDGVASAEEIQRWLTLQRLINHGQLMITVLAGGGLFEWLDKNHDGGLSPRELRGAWHWAETNGCTEGDTFDADRVPILNLMMVSQGYPKTIANRQPIQLDWFRQMDRNEDGDVSRREFTGPAAAFQRLDRDQDQLVSEAEANTK